MKKTIDQAIFRESNLSLVLRNIHNEAPLSRAQLAVMTGLNKSTVSSLVEDLLARGLVHEIGMNSMGAGRPATLLEINPVAGGIVGVELGVDFVAVALMNFGGKVIWRQIEKADPFDEQAKTIKQTIDLADQAIAKCRKMKLRLLGLGLAVPGTVDLQEGVLVYSPNLRWHNVPLRKIFSEHTGLKVFIENDANAAGVAEHLFGVMRQTKDFIFVYAGVGIGGGLFLNGKLYRGHNGFAGEIGHISTAENGSEEACQCGTIGCWETYANQRAVIRRVEEGLKYGRSTIIPQMMTERNETGITVEIVKQAADAGDREALDTFSDVGRAMGLGIAGLVNIFNPEKIVIGGTLSMASGYFLPAVVEAVSKRALNPVMKKTEIIPSVFGYDASLFGAVAIVVEDIMWNPSRVERR
jgi:glucokinase-like ROK family protein